MRIEIVGEDCVHVYADDYKHAEYLAELICEAQAVVKGASGTLDDLLVALDRLRALLARCPAGVVQVETDPFVKVAVEVRSR